MKRAPIALIVVALAALSFSVGAARPVWGAARDPAAVAPGPGVALSGVQQLRLRGGKKAVEADAYAAIQAPKRAMSAYMYFANHMRPQISKAKPDLSMTEISKDIGTKWKALSEADRKKYEAEAEKGKATYEKQKAEFEAKVPEEVRKQRLSQAKAKKEKILKRKNKDPNAPKKALSAFMLYSNKVRDSVKKANPDMSFGELGKAIANKWNAMGPDQKKEYEQESEALKAKYLVAKAKYDEEHPPAVTGKVEKAKKPKAGKDGKKKDGKKSKASPKA